jgi:hypothetical protein
MTEATPLTDAEINNLANQPRAYALTNAKALATITSLRGELQRTRDALEGAYALSIGWAAHWKCDHGNFAPEHLEILDQCAKALGLDILPSKAFTPPTGESK